MVWNYRFYKGVLFECSYDEQGRPDDYYSETSFEHLFSTEKYDQMVEEWTKEWEREKNGYIIGPLEIVVRHDDGSETREIFSSEPTIIPPKDVGTLEDYLKAKMAEDWQELKEAIDEATWYDEQGFVPLAEEVEKPIEQRTCIIHLKDDEFLSENEALSDLTLHSEALDKVAPVRGDGGDLTLEEQEIISDAYIRRQAALFDALPKEKLLSYKGQYVFFEEGEIKDSDISKINLAKRVFRKEGYRDIFLEKVV